MHFFNSPREPLPSDYLRERYPRVWIYAGTARDVPKLHFHTTNLMIPICRDRSLWPAGMRGENEVPPREECSTATGGD